MLAGARLLWTLPAFMRNPVRSDGARAILRRRLEQREADFLALMHGSVYAVPDNLYRQLLRQAGCEYEDLVRLVGREGVEGALRTLYSRGVYLTVDEFKGRKPVQRGSTSISVNPLHLRNPRATVHIPAHSGGSRGQRTTAGIDLEDIRGEGVNLNLFLDGRGGLGWAHAAWSVPGGAAMRWMLRASAAGAVPTRWFSQVDPSAAGLHPRYRWSAQVMRWGSMLGGRPLPAPQYVSPEEPRAIVTWMREVLQSGRVPHLFTFASAAVRICRTALDDAVDIRGAQFTLSGEPATAARLAVITRAGAQALPAYASLESGIIGYGCLAPEVSDDLHLLSDLHAVIQVGAEGEAAGLPPQTLLIMSMRPSAPFVLLNVSLGDAATIVKRACGCPLEKVGWETHLHTVRSYEKLTAGGMTFLDTDVIRVLEEVLPARFGGAPADYQLVEEETGDGRPRLRLLVHPSVGPLDERAIVETFLSAVGAGSESMRVMERLWRDAGFLGVERLPPRVSGSGKILHLHQGRQA